ncbi:MAG: outer membrane protein assembly factor BamE [Gammaproteobacteria bacterium]|nr:outer membrane protein assembly factor BamE [Gammaproteobacteria bacterium]
MKQLLFVLLTCSLLSACSSWVYKYDISQGNFLNQDDIDKLRIDMTKEQVEYVLGTTLLKSAFSDDKWLYVHTLKSGKTDKTTRREVIVNFENGLLKSIEGTLKEPENFNEPLDATN